MKNDSPTKTCLACTSRNHARFKVGADWVCPAIDIIVEIEMLALQAGDYQEETYSEEAEVYNRLYETV